MLYTIYVDAVLLAGERGCRAGVVPNTASTLRLET